jgi:bacteriophage N4 adsorption protein A
MKENNLNRVIGWSGLLLTSLLSTSALADNIGTSAEELGLSDYRHFVIYPRLDKALKAQKNNDEATAIREFEYIHQQVPDNIPLTLYLAEAYRVGIHRCLADPFLADCRNAGLRGAALCGTAAASGK